MNAAHTLAELLRHNRSIIQLMSACVKWRLILVAFSFKKKEDSSLKKKLGKWRRQDRGNSSTKGSRHTREIIDLMKSVVKGRARRRRERERDEKRKERRMSFIGRDADAKAGEGKGIC